MSQPAGPFTTWHARCCLKQCRTRRVGADGLDLNRVWRWAGYHAHHGGRGGHVVHLWAVESGERKARQVMLRYSDLIDPVEDWMLWGWVCLGKHPGDVRPRWNDGALTPKAVLAEWWAHNCDRKAP